MGLKKMKVGEVFSSFDVDEFELTSEVMASINESYYKSAFGISFRRGDSVNLLNSQDKMIGFDVRRIIGGKFVLLSETKKGRVKLTLLERMALIKLLVTGRL